MQRAPHRLLSAEDAQRTLNKAPNSGSPYGTRTGLLHTRDDDDDTSGRRRVLYVVAGCCSLALCIVVAVLVANALSTDETTTPTPPAVAVASLTATAAAASTRASYALEAATASAPLTLVHLCDVPYAGNTTVLSFFSYSALGAYELPAGSLNRISPGAANQGQTTSFEAGSFIGAARVAWDRAAHTSIAWHLRTSRASDVAASVAHASSASIVACPSLLSL